MEEQENTDPIKHQDQSANTTGDEAEKNKTSEMPQDAESPEEAPEPTPEKAAPASVDDLESDDDTEEVEGEDQEDADSVESELPDYENFSPEGLVKEARKLLQNEAIQKLKEPIESIRKHLLAQLDEDRDQKLENFQAEGGDPADFDYPQPLRDEFKDLYHFYRKERKKYYDELRRRLQENLEIKQELLEQLKGLTKKEESIGNTFKEFHAIIDQWRNTGPVPRMESRDLWRNYHHHVDNFYEFIKINKELRDLDYKKNRAKKEELLKEAEKLSSHPDIPMAFKRLQKLHREWKHTGPVEPEQRETLWKQFSDFTRIIRARRDEHQEVLEEKKEQLLEKKRTIVNAIKELGADHKTHKQWQESLKKLEQLREDFKKIGRLNTPGNDEVWEEYRAALRTFTRAKNAFYQELKKGQQENLKKKEALLEQAQELKDSTDWKHTTAQLKRIQAEWKQIGPAPRNSGDKVWKEFRKACDHFFERLKDQNKEREKDLEKHWKQKQELLEKIKEVPVDKESKAQAPDTLKKLAREWRQIGPVPRDKRSIEKKFEESLEEKFDSLDLSRQEATRINFANKMENLEQRGGHRELENQRRSLLQKREEAQRELGVLETNRSFFSSSKSDSPIVKEADAKIEKKQREISSIEEQLKMLNVKIRQLKRDEQENEED